MPRVVTCHELLVLELVAVDGVAAVPVPSLEVAALDHEVGDDPVNLQIFLWTLINIFTRFPIHLGALVPEARFPCAQLSEVLCGSGHEVIKQLYLHPAQVLAVSRDLQVHLGPLLLA